MALDDADRALIESELGRAPTPSEQLLFENLWSEHCAYRSSRHLLAQFDADDDRVVVGPGDDTAVVRLPSADELTADERSPDGDGVSGGDSVSGDDSAADAESVADAESAVDDNSAPDETYITFGIESHNHPSYVDPHDGAATGVGGIVRDTLSMGAYPIGLADSIYFGSFDRERPRYLFEGVVEGIGGYGNSIGVPTVAGSTVFHPGYEGNPLVNVACLGQTDPDRLVTGQAKQPGNLLVLVGNATGRDGLGGAAFASDDLAEDAETADRPAVQVGDPYAEKRLIECNEQLVDEGLLAAARDLGAAGLGGATAEMVGAAALGAHIDLDRVHRREPGMAAPEILLAESQERMCYEVRPADVTRVQSIADRFDLGCSVIGRVTDGAYVCTVPDDGVDDDEPPQATGPEAISEPEAPNRRVVVDCDPTFLADGAPQNELSSTSPTQPDRAVPDIDLREAVEAVVSAPTVASKRWVYRQYDHEVGTRTAVGPGADAATLAMREAGVGLSLSAGAEPGWTAVAPYEGARATAVENATNLAAVGAEPLAVVDCLNGGNPEDPATYGGFRATVEGVADGCRELDVPVVGGNVSLYNDSAAGPIPPTPTVAMAGVTPTYTAPGVEIAGGGTLVVVGAPATEPKLGGSQLLTALGGSDRFPGAASDAATHVAAIRDLADRSDVQAVHDVSSGGLAVTLAEMIGPSAGARVDLDESSAPVARLFDERPGRAVVETTNPAELLAALPADVPAARLGTTDESGELALTAGDQSTTLDAETVRELRASISRELS